MSTNPLEYSEYSFISPKARDKLNTVCLCLNVLTFVTIGSSETKVTHADAVGPQRFTVSFATAVWTCIVHKLASQLRVLFKERIQQVVHQAIVIYIPNAAFEATKVDLWVVDHVLYATDLKRTKTIQVSVI